MRPQTTLGRLLTQSALFTALALALSVTAQAATINVDSGTDDGAGCTLREAVASANSDTAVGGCTAGDDASDEITFSVGAVTLTAGQIAITEAVTITGPVTINAADNSRIFRVDGSELVTFADVTFQSGNADGGGIFITDASPVVVMGGAFNQNAAPTRGGGIYVSSTGSLNVSGTMFTGNQARGSAANEGGGAIYTNGGTVTVSEATFTDNRALGTSGSGGAILNPNGAALDISASVFTSNRSQRAGGAIETVGGTTIVTGGNFEGNTAGANPGNGGAIHGGGSADITIDGATARTNRAVEGGAYWISSSGTMSILNGTIEGNIAEGASADQGGGGVYVDGGTLSIINGGGQTTFTNNRAIGASGSGGAILVNGGSVTIDGTQFLQNRAQRAGGAIEFTAPASDTDMTAIIDFALFQNNTTGRAPGNGGGIHTTTGDITMNISESEFTGNEAWSEGGGLWINSGTSATVIGTNFSDNGARGMAADNGGGGFFNNGGTATITAATFSGNRTFADGVPGGGLLGVAGSTTVSQSLFLTNYASNGGGVASVGGATVTVENSTLVQNTARFGGAGFSAGGFLSFDSATIASNSASIGGGGLYNQNSQNAGTPFVTLTNSIVANNTATNGADLRGRYASGGWNVVSTTPDAITFPAQASDQTGTDPLLEMLADNGGPTLTVALQSGSPAIDAGNTDLAVDQRGVARTEPDDVGAYEFGDAEGEADILISEFEPNPDGTDPADTTFELSGTPGASFSGTILSIENDGINGTLDRRSEVSGTFDSNGLLVVTVPDLENPTFTVVLATDVPASTTVGTDLDANDDGVIDDLSALGTILDAVAVSDDTADDGTLYASGLGGTDILYNGEFEPLNVFRDASTGQFYQTVTINFGTPEQEIAIYDASGTQLDPADFDADPTMTTFGVINPSMTAPAQLATTSASLSTVELDALAVVPNPFSNQARATFAVGEAQAVSVVLYDVMGRQVQQVFQGAAQAETPVTVSVDGAGLASGVYVLVLQGETVRATRQVTVAR